jgi:hypothetical protein
MHHDVKDFLLFFPRNWDIPFLLKISILLIKLLLSQNFWFLNCKYIRKWKILIFGYNLCYIWSCRLFFYMNLFINFYFTLNFYELQYTNILKLHLKKFYVYLPNLKTSSKQQTRSISLKILLRSLIYDNWECLKIS